VYCPLCVGGVATFFRVPPFFVGGGFHALGVRMKAEIGDSNAGNIEGVCVTSNCSLPALYQFRINALS